MFFNHHIKVRLNRAALDAQQREIWNSLVGYGANEAIENDDKRVLYCSQPQGGAQRCLCGCRIFLLIDIKGIREIRELLAMSGTDV